ncbi:MULTISPECIES: efflux RND transporter periplasmic adaptor subunit [Micromonospora]|uniref:efflux RND transporter periplasmic adaptor subunit n=1 Tax=Micromonospora TaxID=1873 RepID=UPI001E65A722|nr:efflux RND transporter periplasmic adaptor subunit [Micromonospora sp. S4605]
MTTVQPTRQDLANKVSLSGKVTINPVFGIVTPTAGQVRYADVRKPRSTPTRPTRVASVWKSGKAHRIEVPAGAVFAGRLVDDGSQVTAGMPVVSAKRIGYGLVADIDSAQAYQISDALATVQAQIKNGPGPFPCKVLGTIAALPAGTIPDPPAPRPSAAPSGQPSAPPVVEPPSNPQDSTEPSEPTGMRLVCTAPAKVKLINGASATLEVVTARATKVLVLPVEAVAGGQGRGKVDVVRSDGSRETRDVVLGLSDGKVVEIKSGLTGDERVAVPGPNIPPAKPGVGDGPSALTGAK